jgi:hypothetical protein
LFINTSKADSVAGKGLKCKVFNVNANADPLPVNDCD